MFFSSEVGIWRATGHCFPEIQRDNVHLWHPQVRIDDAVAPLNRTPKILGITQDIHFTFGPHDRDCVERSHLRAETRVLPLRAHLELCSQVFYASALQPLHPSHLIVTSTPEPAPSGLLFRPHILRALRVRINTVAHLFCWANSYSFFSLIFKFIICTFFVSHRYFCLRREHGCCEREKVYFFINIDNHLAFLQGLCMTDSIKSVFIIFLYPENLRRVLHMLCLLV